MITDTIARPAARTSADAHRGTGAPSFWRAVVRGALTMVLLAVLVLAIALAVVPRVMGGQALTVLTGSMEPTYAPGDMIVTVPRSTYAIGDAVTFQPEPGDPTLVTHRIIAITSAPGGTEYTTRGDANGSDDAPIVADQVMGKVIYSVPYVGHLSVAAGEHRATILAVAGAGLIGYSVYVAGAALASRRRSTHPQTRGE